MKLTDPFTIFNQKFNEIDLIRDAMKIENYQLKVRIKTIEKCINFSNLLVNH